MRLTKTDRLILQEASKIRRELNEMADWSNIEVPEKPEDRDERIRRAIVAGKVKDLNLKDLSDADLRGAQLRDAKLRMANLRRAKLSNADLRDADLWDADLTDADLSEAKLEGANLAGAELIRAEMWEANFERADLTGEDGIKCNSFRGKLRRLYFGRCYYARGVERSHCWHACSIS